MYDHCHPFDFDSLLSASVEDVTEVAVVESLESFDVCCECHCCDPGSLDHDVDSSIVDCLISDHPELVSVVSGGVNLVCVKSVVNRTVGESVVVSNVEGSLTVVLCADVAVSVGSSVESLGGCALGKAVKEAPVVTRVGEGEVVVTTVVCGSGATCDDGVSVIVTD